MTTDSSDTQSPPTTPDSTMSTPSTPDTNRSPPTTMHFEAAPAELTDQQELIALFTKLSDDNMKALNNMFEKLSTKNDDKIEKHKRDLANQVKAEFTNSRDDIDNRIETVFAKVTDVESDMQGAKLDIDDLEAFQHDVAPKIDQAISLPASSTLVSSDARNAFPRFSGYMGTRTTLQQPVSPDEYYKFVLPASTTTTGSYVDPTIPSPVSTHATDATGNPNDQGLFPLANNLTIDMHKFQKTLNELQLAGDDVLSLRDFYHGIRMALNTCGKHHIDILPMFEDLCRDDRFTKLLLPHDSNGQINNTDFRYNQCLRMYHTFGQLLLVAFTNKKIVTAALSPKAYSIFLSNKNLRNGWDLLWTILCKRAPHLGGNNLDVHDMITNLKVEPGESLAVFCNRSLQIQHTIAYSQTQIPETRLFFKFMTTLMTCGSIRMYIASQFADLRRHINQFGEHVNYPVDDIQSIHEYLDTANLDETALHPDSPTGSSTNNVYNQSPSPQPHIARVNGNRDIPSCECCLRRGHLADTCFARGIQFLPPDIQRRIAQYNATHGDRPKFPPKASNHPSPVKYPPRTNHQSTAPKPNIKVLIGDLTDTDQLINDADPEIFDFIDNEEEFVDAVDTPASPIATIKQMAVN